MVVRHLIQVQLITMDLILNMEDMDHLRSLVVVLLSLVQDREVTVSPSLEVVHLPFPVEMEYRSLIVKHLLSMALLLSPMVDTLDHLRPLVDTMRLLDLLHTLVDIILLLDLLHTLVDIILLLDLLHTLVDIILLLDLLHTLVDIILLGLLHTLVDIILLLYHTVAVDIMHLLDHLRDSLARPAMEVPVLLNSLEVILRHGLISRAVITLPIQVGGETKNID